MTATPPASVCPNCSAPAAGRFCANCGSALGGALCAECRAPLTPGAKYCHRCGTPVGGRAGVSEPKGAQSALPWAVAGIALLALVAMLAGQFFGRRGEASPSFTGTGDGTMGPGLGAASRAPDISGQSTDVLATRLFDRIMRLHEEGKTDSVQFFAPMALSTYRMLPELDADQRYDLGRIGEVTGSVGLVRAQADSILREQPTHLLGLALAARGAEMAGDAAARRDYLRRLLAAEQSELAKNLPEYSQHRNDIDATLARARAQR